MDSLDEELFRRAGDHSPAEAVAQVSRAIGDATSPRRELPDAVLGRLQQVVRLLVVHFKVPLVGAQPQRHLLQPHRGIEATRSARSLAPRCPAYFLRVLQNC